MSAFNKALAASIGLFCWHFVSVLACKSSPASEWLIVSVDGFVSPAVSLVCQCMHAPLFPHPQHTHTHTHTHTLFLGTGGASTASASVVVWPQLNVAFNQSSHYISGRHMRYCASLSLSRSHTQTYRERELIGVTFQTYGNVGYFTFALISR